MRSRRSTSASTVQKPVLGGRRQVFRTWVKRRDSETPSLTDIGVNCQKVVIAGVLPLSSECSISNMVPLNLVHSLHRESIPKSRMSREQVSERPEISRPRFFRFLTLPWYSEFMTPFRGVTWERSGVARLGRRIGILVSTIYVKVEDRFVRARSCYPRAAESSDESEPRKASGI